MSIYLVQTPIAAHRQWIRLRHRFATTIVLIAGLLSVSTATFAAIDDPGVPLADRLGRGLWNSMNIVSTVGDLGSFTTAQRAWAMVVMILGLTIAGFAFTTLTALVTGGDFRQIRENRRMERTLTTLSGHTVVVGYDELGARLAASVARKGATAVVIERDAANADQAAKDGFLVVQGEATEDATLRAAGVERADAVFVPTFDAQAKLMIVLSIRELTAKPSVVAVARNARGADLLKRAGANAAIEPTDLLARAMIESIARSDRA